MQNIKLIIGLGNPDEKYYDTYHNAGHLFVDYLKTSSSKSQALKSSVYMNQSGKFTKEELKKHKIKPKNLLIVHDDTDLHLGNYKFSFGRGSAGNKGVQNIIDQLKTKDFWRLRIGIRPASRQGGNPKERKRVKADQLVLKKITSANKKLLDKVFEEANKRLNSI